MKVYLPNALTLLRIIAVPLVVALLYVDGHGWRWLACVVFSAAGLTDWLDGYLARAWRVQSAFGRMLDPIADKLLVAATLMVLVARDYVAGWVVFAALIILCREILVSGLREYLASLQVGLPVSRLAKWKTLLQMLAIGFLIVGDSGFSWAPIRLIGEIGLAAAACLTLYTGWDYLRASARHVGNGPRPAGAVPPGVAGSRSHP